jgi:dCTP deaminase
VGLLSDADILRCRADGSIAIEPFVESHMTPNGYDVSVAEVVIPSNGLHVKEGTAQIPPHARFAVGSRETVTLGPSIAGQIWLRTTWARRGVVTSFGMIDAGFSGNLTFGAFNAAEEPLALPIGDRFAQIIFFTLESAAASAYEARSGHYQGQRGVTLDRP